MAKRRIGGRWLGTDCWEKRGQWWLRPQGEPVDLWGLGGICWCVLPHKWKDDILGVSAMYTAVAWLSAGWAAFCQCWRLGMFSEGLPGASVTISMGPRFPSVSGFLAWKKVLLYMLKIKRSNKAPGWWLRKDQCYADWSVGRNSPLHYTLTLNVLYPYPCSGFGALLPTTDNLLQGSITQASDEGSLIVWCL